MPKGLSPSAKLAWKAIVSDLAASGLLNPVDSAIIELAAVALGRARDARALVEREGMIVEGGRGRLVKHPGLLIEQQAGVEARRCLESLGIGPSARARASSQQPSHVKSMQAFDAAFPLGGSTVFSEMAELRDRKAAGKRNGGSSK